MSHSLNESMIGCWINPPVFLSKRRTLKETLRYYHDAKRVFIFKEIKKILKTKKRIKVLDFGSGHGGLSIDVKKYFGESVDVCGYEVSPMAHEISLAHSRRASCDVCFVLDKACDIRLALQGQKFDVIISTDVFGHVPDLPTCFKNLHSLLNKNGHMIAFSESQTGKAIDIINYLKRKGAVLDESEKAHISLYPCKELRSFLLDAKFSQVKVMPFAPIRFPFYPKRYLKHLSAHNKFLYFCALFLSLFQNPLTEVFYNNLNLFLSQFCSHKRDTAGCFIKAEC